MAVLREVNHLKDYPLHRKVTLIGRDPACDVVVATEQTSWRHALLVQCGGAYFLEDLESVNGSYVNGQRVNQRALLHPGDRIDISGLSVEFDPDVAAGPPEPPTRSASTVLDSSGAARAEPRPEAKLRAVLEISRRLSTALDFKEVLPSILESLFTVFPQADRAFLLLRDPDSGQMVPRAARRRDGRASDALAVSRGIIEQVQATGRPVLSDDAGRDARFDPEQSIRRFQIRSVLCAPLMGRAGDVLGVVQLDAQDVRRPFRQEDAEVLETAAAQAARAVELARLYQERRDLEAATQIQTSFLPTERPRVPGVEFFDYYSPARDVGGDYFDYVPLPGGRWAVALGDVSGKGVPAALLMARLSAAARFTLAGEADLPAAVRKLNQALMGTGRDDRFITFVAAVLEADGAGAALVNAGHLPPLLRRAGGAAVEEVWAEAVGLPLAVMDRPYEQTAVQLAPGDCLVLFTDGVTEARNPANELYGPERLQAAVRRAPEGAEAVGQAVLADVRRFAAGRPQHDDLTVVCVGRVASTTKEVVK
jgi:serine phosphatase RsbU (regulator of sigma subunit)